MRTHFLPKHSPLWRLSSHLLAHLTGKPLKEGRSSLYPFCRCVLCIREVGFSPWGWGRSPGGGHGNPLQYSCLENPMDRGAWRATVHRVAELHTAEVTEHSHTHTPFHCRGRGFDPWLGNLRSCMQYGAAKNGGRMSGFLEVKVHLFSENLKDRK